jgi:hypothetical protein
MLCAARSATAGIQVSFHRLLFGSASPRIRAYNADQSARARPGAVRENHKGNQVCWNQTWFGYDSPATPI